MNLSIKKNQLFDFIINQINSYFKDNIKVKKSDILSCLNLALDKTSYCFSKINDKYYYDRGNKKIIFNHLNSDHLATFLYFLSYACFENEKKISICDKIYYLNKSLNSVDIYYQVKLPDIFLLVHPVGTVLGRAIYKDYLIVYQGVNVGSNKENSPKFSKFTTLRPSSIILGKCNIDINCEIAAGSILIDQNLSKNTIYYGNPKKFYTKKKNSINEIWN
jgi:serine O-acetyltransferase